MTEALRACRLLREARRYRAMGLPSIALRTWRDAYALFESSREARLSEWRDVTIAGAIETLWSDLMDSVEMREAYFADRAEPYRRRVVDAEERDWRPPPARRA